MDNGGVSSEIANKFPLHACVWENNIRKLRSLLELKEEGIENLDPRGRTPLHLAITLGHLESAQLLLKAGADANAENSQYWTALHEATSTGDPEIVQHVLQYRDYQRILHKSDGIPALLKKLMEAPDFYVEMTWEFTSWLPLVSRMCPSDTYKVYKSGSMVRIDMTLIGFDNMKWERGHRSQVYKGLGDTAELMEIDHDTHTVYSETIELTSTPPSVDFLLPSADQVSARLTAPVATSYVNTEQIEFERAKQGIWGFRSDKTETINGHQCKVFNASNVQLITKTRLEHLCPDDKKASKKNKFSLSPLETFLGIAERHKEKPAPIGDDVVDIHNPCCITPEEYFNSEIDLEKRDIGRPREISTRIQKFKPSLWLSEDYPLTLQEQVLPIIDLMAATNTHFKKLRDFITLQLPAGFPVKIEIPVFHALNARVTFGNIFSSDRSVLLISPIHEEIEVPADGIDRDSGDDDVQTIKKVVVTSCAVDGTCFEPPPGYRVMKQGSARYEVGRFDDQEDQLLQYAIQKSLIDESGTEPQDKLTLAEALKTFDPNQYTGDDTSNGTGRPSVRQMEYNDQLQLAIALSEQPSATQQTVSQTDEIARREQEELEKVLALSLVDK